MTKISGLLICVCVCVCVCVCQFINNAYANTTTDQMLGFSFRPACWRVIISLHWPFFEKIMKLE
jgi:hypothetical protein